jgi:hypothetical protein
VNFNASLYGRSLDGLSYAQVINTNPYPVFAKIRITVREMNQGQAVTVNIPYRQYNARSSTINSREFALSNFVFARNTLGMQVGQTGKFPDGEYDYCFEVTVGDPKTQVVIDVSEYCFQSVIEPITPLLLIDPAPDDKFCNTRPGFTWQPPIPLQRGAQYRIIVCEKMAKQTDIEAITYNIPVINIGGMYVNTIPFPAKTPELKKDKKYVWQVTVYQEKTILTKSEIWEFEIKCEEEKKPLTGYSYRELKETEDGNFYIADTALRISFNNPYNPGKLDYSIVALSEPDKKIKRLPELKLYTGLNKYDIDLSENSSFKNGQEYMITVRLENNRTLKLRFIYRNKTL